MTTQKEQQLRDDFIQPYFKDLKKRVVLEDIAEYWLDRMKEQEKELVIEVQENIVQQITNHLGYRSITSKEKLTDEYIETYRNLIDMIKALQIESLLGKE
jgi:hypothetical protein